MKVKIFLMALAILAMGVNVYAAGDLTVDGNLTVGGNETVSGNLTVNGNITNIQAGSLLYTTTAWTTVTFPIAFSSPAVVIVRGAKTDTNYTGSATFIIAVRPILNDNFQTGFQFRAIDNATDTVHAVNPGCPATPAKCDTIHWTAMTPTQQ